MIQESVTYQGILDEGRLDEARRTLFRYAEKQRNPPSEEVKAVVATLNDLERLHRMIDLALEGKSWDEVLRSP